MLTLKEFRASGRDTDSIGFAVDDSALEGVPGRVYLGCLYIEHLATGMWRVPTLAEYFDFPNLPEAEVSLYDWAVAEGYCGNDDAKPAAATRDILREAFRGDLNTAVALIQGALGIATGDTAGLYLSDKDSEWAMASGWGRAELLVPWLRAELLEAGEAHGPVESEDEAKRQSYARDEPGEAPARPSVTLDRTR